MSFLFKKCFQNYHAFLNKLPTKETKNNTKKIKNKTLAIEAAPAAMPPKPKIAAIIATTKNVIDQRIITLKV